MKINPTKTVNELVTIIPYILDTIEKKNYHSWKVAIISALCCQNYTDTNQIKHIFYAALLHDIAGVGFPFHIIHYLKRSDKTSRNILLSHPIIGAQLASDFPQMNLAAKFILDHHEWINGTGYPRAKQGKDIPLGSQIIRIANSIDIALQIGQVKKLNQLKRKMSVNINKEYSKNLFNKAFSILKNDHLFYKISSRKNVPMLFEQIRDKTGRIKMPAKADAIGKALEAVAEIIDMKHPFTSGHSLRVSRYAMAIALAMKLEHDEVTAIRWAGLIHDIGKLTVPRKILDKTTKLTAKEYQQIKKHAKQTYKIINMITTLRDITLVASCHHEYYDGSGYPFGLMKDQIPLGARILCVCDTLDAMTSNRPYRKPFTFETACNEIKRMSGKQFDPQVTNYALPLFKNFGV